MSDFKSYNGIANAFVIKNTNFTVNASTLSWLSGARTYIIENWDLVIEGDVTYADTIAFVVRGWDIQINKAVKTIKGTFIASPKSNVWGKIVWAWWKTTEPLKVYGSLYGNVEWLISQRTYVKSNSTGLLDVGTVVSFWSSVFRDPAPLTTTFINEYLEATKVAQ
jgi:hypothetical protein